MAIKLFVCLGICLVVFLGSIAGVSKGMDLADSKEPREEMTGNVISAASFITTLASLAGVIIFAIKLFALYLYGVL